MTEKKKKGDFQKGVDHFEEKAAAKKEGYDDTNPNADSFKEGYRRGKEIKGKDNKDSSEQVRDKVNKDYKGKDKDGREAYKKGYAAGSKR